jgi:hypothetical protein
MPVCKSCKEEVDELVSVKVNGRNRKLCEDCAQEAEANAEIADAAEAAIQDKMGYKGRW